MDKKEKRKILIRNISWVFLQAFVFLNDIMPKSVCFFLGWIAGSLAYWLPLPHNKYAIDSLTIAYPDMPLPEKKKIVFKLWINLARWSLEAFSFLKKKCSLDDIVIKGKVNLDGALKRGKGVILMTAHMGNFPLMFLKLAKEGYPINVVARPMRDERTGNYIHNLRVQAGIKTILSYPRKDCINGILKALRSNEIVAILMDQNFGTGGVWVKFFGELAATPVGPIIFALRTASSIVPAYIHSEVPGKHHIEIFPGEQLVLKENNDETLLVNAVKLTRIIESWVRQWPYQWGWIHRRWKSRPTPEIMNTKFMVEA